MIKNHKSTVLSVAWSPNNKFVVTGSTDYKARIFSAFIDNLDDPEDSGGFGGIWKEQNKFGAQLAEYEHAKAWVSAVAWSPNGQRVAFSGHGSSVHIITVSGNAVQTINEKHLPHLELRFVDDNTLVAAGFEMNPCVYVAETDGKWKFKEFLDKMEKKKEEKKAGIATTKQMWQDTASRGQEFGTEAEDLILTRHENVISSIRFIGKGEITTSGLDGRLLYWKVK